MNELVTMKLDFMMYTSKNGRICIELRVSIKTQNSRLPDGTTNTFYIQPLVLKAYRDDQTCEIIR